MNVYDPKDRIITHRDVGAAWLVAAVVVLLILFFGT